MKTQVKICGLTSAADAEIMNELRPDYAGIVLFYPKSKRNQTLLQAEEILKALRPEIRPIAVVVSPTGEQLRQIAALPFFAIQIHGALSDALLKDCPLPVFRAFQASELPLFPAYRKNPKIIGYVFDAAEPGSGKSFDWNKLLKLPRDEKLWMLAGGLTPENVAEAISFVHPDVVDVSSGVERDDAPGKDRKKASAFLKAVKNATP